jgi:hypothetical protein
VPLAQPAGRHYTGSRPRLTQPSSSNPPDRKVSLGDQEQSTRRPRVDRRPDYGNVIYIDCRRCGTRVLLDPARMEHKLGVLLLCRQCGQRFLVRHTDILRPAPDVGLASLYTTPSPKPASRWSRWLHGRS